MKKGFLFGLGILFAGVAFAAIVTIDTKADGSSLLPSEFNQVTTALNSFENTCASNKVLTGFTGDGSGNLSFQCVDDQTGTGVTAKDCGSGSFFQTVDASGVFTCVAEGAGSSVWQSSGSDILYATGNVGVGVTPKTTLDVTGGIVSAKEFCFDGVTATGSVDSPTKCVTQSTLDGISALISGGTGTGDNLGNHTATQDITIGSNIITRGGFTTGVGTLGIDPLGITTSSSGVKVGFINTPCTQSIVGTLRLDDQNIGGAAYSLQVCMSQTVGGWGWYTIMDSNNGIPSGTGICDPITGVCT